VAIGWPVGNLTVFILDRELSPAPAGVAGELCVGGVGVGRGYLDMPERTALAFVPDPFSTEPGQRLYRSGDKARRLTDGRIEFLGRMDYQVKLRGFRIELGEIESVLRQHPDVGEAVAMVREDMPGDPRLVAYLVSRDGNAPTSSDLREHLKQQLPDYMAPSAYVVLEAMPLSRNGKIDRKALPSPSDLNRVDDAAEYVEPQTELEQTIAAV
jgi:acyl-coenzyme A synthetase/AMP-(fatty) acid ligase